PETPPTDAAPTPVAVEPPAPTPAPAPGPIVFEGEIPAFYAAVGRRKTAVARVRMKPNGTGKFVINKKRSLEQYFEREADRLAALSSLEAVGAQGKFDVFLTLTGGGTAGQAGATRMGIARCLSRVNGGFLETLKSQGYLTRDAREKER